MIDSKAWKWDIVKGDHERYWQEPAIGAYYLLSRWHSQDKKDFLDLGCGLGRHTIQFAKAGFNTSGFDLSEEAVKRTKKYAKEAGVKIDLQVGDMLICHIPKTVLIVSIAAMSSPIRTRLE